LIDIDGSWGEGGGQILRVALALSSVLCEPVKIYNIRAKRPKPGLRTQHLTAIKVITKLTNAEVSGGKIGSKKILFHPNGIRESKLIFDTKTAASTTLILQGLLPAALFASGKVEGVFYGGTNNPWAPPFEYMQHVFLPTILKMGVKGSITLLKRGFYPKGGGSINFKFEPVDVLKPLEIVDFNKVESLFGLSYSCKLPCHIVKRVAESSHKVLLKELNLDGRIVTECLQLDDDRCSLDPGCGITLFIKLHSGGILAGDSLGKIGKPAERVGLEASKALVDQMFKEAPVDVHLADQLIPYMALAKGRSRIRVTKLSNHTITCIHVTEEITGASFEVSGALGEPSLITCKGIGYTNNQIK
jgi:RNA 3'-phosphate cyclase